ncbi:MAG: nucleotide exchange factor GrpE [Clostridiaceae bacterium]
MAINNEENENIEDSLEEGQDVVEENEILEEEKLEEDVEEIEYNVEEVEENNLSLLKKLKEEKNLLTEDNKKLQNEMETIKDRLARTLAEYENFRKRTIKEKEGIYSDACKDVIETMISPIDNLERALAVGGDIDSFKKGVEMTLRQFDDSMKKLNVEEIATDCPFDPNMHNAVMHIDDDSLGEKEIVEVFQKGYKRQDKIIRHSMVKVAN